MKYIGPTEYSEAVSFYAICFIIIRRVDFMLQNIYIVVNTIGPTEDLIMDLLNVV